MNILVVMIPLSILVLVGAGIAFFWAVDNHQFDDMESPRLLPLLDNPDRPASTAVSPAQTAAAEADSGVSDLQAVTRVRDITPPVSPRASC